MTPDAARICRMIAEEIWEKDREGWYDSDAHQKRPDSLHTQDWKEKAFIADMTALLHHTVVPKMVGAFEKILNLPSAIIDIPDLAGRTIRDHVTEIFTDVQRDTETQNGAE